MFLTSQLSNFRPLKPTESPSIPSSALFRPKSHRYYQTSFLRILTLNLNKEDFTNRSEWRLLSETIISGETINRTFREHGPQFLDH